jgi:hypothetical protein
MRKPKPGHELHVACRAETFYIRFLLEAKRVRPIDIAFTSNLSVSSVFGALNGHNRSVRAEKEIAHILGKSDWNEVVTEARQAVKYVTGTNLALLGGPL